MKITKLKLIVAFGFGIFLAACSKQEPSCYSRELEKEYKERMCTMDCPDMLGAMGKPIVTSVRQTVMESVKMIDRSQNGESEN